MSSPEPTTTPADAAAGPRYPQVRVRLTDADGNAHILVSLCANWWTAGYYRPVAGASHRIAVSNTTPRWPPQARIRIESGEEFESPSPARWLCRPGNPGMADCSGS
jgi:hypothetical protein